MNGSGRLGSSFRDPSGFLFERDGVLYRQINESYEGDYRYLIESGLYESLATTGRIVPHEEVDEPPFGGDQAVAVLRPEHLSFVSYPYEWCFSQYRDAALATLDLQASALEHGMWLKDASAYNIQFLRGRPVLIDSLSFERYPTDSPWVAYKQFCEHFLAPLALMALRDVRLGQLMRVHIDGVPLDLAAALLPASARARPALLAHIFLHASSQRRRADAPAKPGTYRMRRRALEGLVSNLRSAVRRLRWKAPKTAWGNYYDDTNYADRSIEHKEQLVRRFLERCAPRTLWDLGANTGRFSRLATDELTRIVAFDVDPAAVEQCYRRVREEGDERLLPLLLDLTNPSPDMGWRQNERTGLRGRAPVDTCLALALVHHLAIGNNVPLADIAAFIAELSDHLIIEWVPKRDSQVRRMLASREDVFPGYTEEDFRAAFGTVFETVSREEIEGTGRVLYLMRNLRPHHGDRVSEGRDRPRRDPDD